jgi:hypothetical protein
LLLNLPWEFLYDRSINRFLSLSVETPIVRYLAVDYPTNPLRTLLPLRVLVMVSNPNDAEYQDLDVEKEIADLKKAVASLQEKGHLFLDFIPATLDDLKLALRENRYQIFHFIGHGGFDPGSQDGALVLETDGGRASITSGGTLGTFLSDHGPLCLAVLNACEGARSANNDPFAGVAQTLVQQGVPAVVAMQFEITDRAAIAFSKDFYASLVLGLPVDFAVSEARKGIYAQPNATEWATPVLYLRSPDGVLFDIEVSKKTQNGVGTTEAERLEAERVEAERVEAERVEAERVEAERLEAERVEAERVEAERLEAERVEAERVEAERREAERREAERREAERREAERREARRSETIEDPRSILEPLRRTPTLLLLGFALLGFALQLFFLARSLDTNSLQSGSPYNLARDYAVPFAWGMGSAAAFLGAYYVGRSASRVTPNTRLLLVAGVALAVSALGSLMGAIGDNGSHNPTFLDLARGLIAFGTLVVGFLCFVLANRDRTLKVGPTGRSPVGPLALGGVGLWLFTVHLYPGFSWVVGTGHFVDTYRLCNVIASVGLIALGGALVLTGVYRAGPAVRLFVAAAALLLLALMNIVYAYSNSSTPLILSASLLSVAYVCVAIVFFVSALLTRVPRRDAKDDREVIART